jgi:hypothetical protein
MRMGDKLVWVLSLLQNLLKHQDQQTLSVNLGDLYIPMRVTVKHHLALNRGRNHVERLQARLTEGCA